jgi:hypothetical protein
MKAGAFINAQNIALWITNILMETKARSKPIVI